MTLASGTRIGGYEITRLLGSGGMGEVYRAHDSRLNRDVAIKVLLPSVANDAERLARFAREAQVLASLDHPNIAHIHGLEPSDPDGSPIGVRALVMELVEGPTLADRLAKGALPVDEAIEIATQIAEALQAAHDHGVIHRDLKPANVKVREDGTVKVLDFGLAKAIVSAVGRGPRRRDFDSGPLIVGRLVFQSDADLFVRNPDGALQPVVATAASEREGRLSPTGTWLAYSSNENGPREVYVQSFPTGRGKWQISRDGGAQPMWSRDGRELFYTSGNRRARRAGATFVPGTARVLFEIPLPERTAGDPGRYAVSPDGKRFMVLTTVPGDKASQPSMNVILNWPALARATTTPP